MSKPDYSLVERWRMEQVRVETEKIIAEFRAHPPSRLLLQPLDQEQADFQRDFDEDREGLHR